MEKNILSRICGTFLVNSLSNSQVAIIVVLFNSEAQDEFDIKWYWWRGCRVPHMYSLHEVGRKRKMRDGAIQKLTSANWFPQERCIWKMASSQCSTMRDTKGLGCTSFRHKTGLPACQSGMFPGPLRDVIKILCTQTQTTTRYCVNISVYQRQCKIGKWEPKY